MYWELSRQRGLGRIGTGEYDALPFEHVRCLQRPTYILAIQSLLRTEML